MAAKKKASKNKAAKPAAKKVAKSSKKAGAKKVNAAAPVLKKTVTVKGKKSFTKSETLSTIADMTGVTRKDVGSVFEALGKVIEAHVAKTGPEVFAFPGLMKIKVVKKPATKARKGINPFTGQEMMFKAKPASRKIKVLALKNLKDMAK